MRRYWIFGAAAAAVLLIRVATISPAPAAAASADVLTYGSLGGTNIPVNDQIQADLKPGTSVTFFEPNTTTGAQCSTSSLGLSVASNPSAPGTADLSLTSLAFSNCTTNVSGTSGIDSITLNNLPVAAAASDSSGDTLTIGSISATAVVNTVIGQAKCTYTAPSLSGAISLQDQDISFSNDTFSLASGPGVCFSTMELSGQYGPVVDSSQAGSPGVFIN